VLGAAEARGLGRQSVGVDHLILALLQPECPGPARRILESVGLSLEESREMYSRTFGDPFTPLGPERVISRSLAAQLVLERATLWTSNLHDREPTGEHVLLAAADASGSAILQQLMHRGITREVLLELVLAAGETSDHENRAGQSATQQVQLAQSPAGHDPTNRQPWSSIAFQDEQGRLFRHGPALQQYFVDRDGYPVLTHGGKPVHMLLDDGGKPRFDVLGSPILIPVEVPPGARILQAARTPSTL